jgi:hypothetical protein
MKRKSRRKDLTQIDPAAVVGDIRQMLKFFRLSRNTQGKTKLPLTQWEVAKLMGCTDGVISKIEHGDLMDAKYLRQYWVALGFRFDQLLEVADGWTISDELFFKVVNKRGLVADKAVRNVGKRLLSAYAA